MPVMSCMPFMSGVGFIESKIRRGECVYVHCKSGVGRCAMVVKLDTRLYLETLHAYTLSPER